MKNQEEDRYREVVKGSHSYLAIPEMEGAGNALHLFTTRQGGLGRRSGGVKCADDWSPVAALLHIAPERLVTVQQVHGTAIVTIDESNFRSLLNSEADALITRTPGIAIAVETADCVPLLLVDPATPAIAAVHAGWRSTAGRIAARTIDLMRSAFGTDPSQVRAAFGPAIGPECYEVDEPVMGPMRQAFPFLHEVASPRGNDKWSLDLVRTNKRELLRAGLQEKNIHELGLCTSCRQDLFYSFRAEGRTGRMLSVVMIKP